MTNVVRAPEHDRTIGEPRMIRLIDLRQPYRRLMMSTRLRASALIASAVFVLASCASSADGTSVADDKIVGLISLILFTICILVLSRFFLKYGLKRTARLESEHPPKPSDSAWSDPPDLTAGVGEPRRGSEDRS